MPRDVIVDANAYARLGTSLERSFGGEMQRLSEAGVLRTSPIEATFDFSLFDGHPAIDGALTVDVVMTCQRCMRPATIGLQERYQVLVVSEDRADESAGYEPVIAEAGKLDLRWLCEEQVLLALPLVPMHEQHECIEVNVESSPPPADDESVQRPFQNLRDMLR